MNSHIAILKVYTAACVRSNLFVFCYQKMDIYALDMGQGAPSGYRRTRRVEVPTWASVYVMPGATSAGFMRRHLWGQARGELYLPEQPALFEDCASLVAWYRNLSVDSAKEELYRVCFERHGRTKT